MKILPVQSKGDLEAYIELAYALYRSDPLWGGAAAAVPGVCDPHLILA